MVVVLVAGAVSYTANSNTSHVKWTLGCGGPTVCVLFQAGGGNASFFEYSVRIVSLNDVSNQFINTTVVDGVSSVVYSLNGTIGSNWLFGPYTWKHNHGYNYVFDLSYNGTFGVYQFDVNVLQD